MSKAPFISIVIPVYKAADTIPRCVNSVVAQTYQDWELILVEDGSPDNSGIIIDALAQRDSRIRTIHQANGGPGKARNTGIDNAVGRYVLFIDADDTIGPKHLEDLAKKANPSVPMLICQGVTKIMDQVTQELSFMPRMYQSSEMQKILEENPVSRMGFSVCKLYDRNVLNRYQIRMDTEITLGEDLMFLLHYLLHIDQVCFIDKVDYYYDNRGVSLSLSRPRPFPIEMRTFQVMMYFVKQLAKKYAFSIEEIPVTLKFNYSYFERALRASIVHDKNSCAQFIKECKELPGEVSDYMKHVVDTLRTIDRVSALLFAKQKFLFLYCWTKTFYSLKALKAKIR